MASGNLLYFQINEKLLLWKSKPGEWFSFTPRHRKPPLFTCSQLTWLHEEINRFQKIPPTRGIHWPYEHQVVKHGNEDVTGSQPVMFFFKKKNKNNYLEFWKIRILSFLLEPLPTPVDWEPLWMTHMTQSLVKLVKVIAMQLRVTQNWLLRGFS